jgi:plasmid stability protein
VPDARKKALAAYRRRLKRRGVIRLELQVRKADAPLVRGVAAALADPSRESEARAILRERFAAGQARGLKALLAAAPLEGVELDRAPDPARDVDL